MTCDDLVLVPASVNARHLGGAVGVNGGQVNEPPRVHGCPRDVVEPDGTVSHCLSPSIHFSRAKKPLQFKAVQRRTPDRR
jgi:hypothetical protein